MKKWDANKPVNRNLSLKGCWLIVNTAETLEECKIAYNWIYDNEVITNDEYDDLMITLSYKTREAYRTA